MPTYIIKVHPDRDAYMEWSTIVDAPTSIGTRADYLAENDETRLARTDLQGTSARHWKRQPPRRQFCGWDDTEGPIYMQRGYLPRAHFADVYDLLDQDIDAEIPPDWLTPLEDDDEDPAENTTT